MKLNISLKKLQPWFYLSPNKNYDFINHHMCLYIMHVEFLAASKLEIKWNNGKYSNTKLFLSGILYCSNLQWLVFRLGPALQDAACITTFNTTNNNNNNPLSTFKLHLTMMSAAENRRVLLKHFSQHQKRRSLLAFKYNVEKMTVMEEPHKIPIRSF